MKKHILSLSCNLSKDTIKQGITSNTLLNIVLSGKGDVKRKFKTQIPNIKDTSLNVEIST